MNLHQLNLTGLQFRQKRDIEKILLDTALHSVFLKSDTGWNLTSYDSNTIRRTRTFTAKPWPDLIHKIADYIGSDDEKFSLVTASKPRRNDEHCLQLWEVVFAMSRL